MSKIENLSLNVIGGLVTIALLSILGALTGFFKDLSLDIKLFIIGMLLVVLLLLNLRIFWTIHRIAFPKKPPLVKARDKPEVFIYLQGQWRWIPDWQTRDYLAHVLGFRPGEVDIAVKPQDEVDKLQKGAPLDSIITYAR